MPETAVPTAGRFVWRELTVPDPAAAAAFYGATFGWTAEQSDMGMPYTMLRMPGVEAAVGGAMAPPEAHIPPHWVDYVLVDALEAAMGRVEAAGGRLLTPAMDIPGVGRFAMAMDPQGGAFALFVGPAPAPAPAPAAEVDEEADTEQVVAPPSDPDPLRVPMGTFCWSQLMTTDLAASARFYAEVVGWTAEQMAPEMVVFHDATGRPRASAMQVPAGAPQPHAWLQYVAVPEVAPALETAVAAGATVVAPPTQMPGRGEFAVLADPQGAVFALWRDEIQG